MNHTTPDIEADAPPSGPTASSQGATSLGEERGCVTMPDSHMLPSPTASTSLWLTEALKIWCATPAIHS